MLPTTASVRIVSTIIVALSVTAGVTSSVIPHPHSDAESAYSRQDVSFENDGLILHGSILSPVATGETAPEEARHPAVVIVAGSGPRERNDYVDEARAFAASGIVTLIYDKRDVGYSLTERSYAQLGDDAIAGLRMLQARPDVDPTRAGLWGHSEGGWVVPLAAATHPAVSFVVVAGASAHPPAQVQAWSTCRYLSNSGFPDRFCAPLGMNLTRLMISGGIFPEADFNPLTALEQLDVPSLAVFAEHDRSTAPVTSAQEFSKILGESPSSTVCVVPDADHEFRRSTNGFVSPDGLNGDERFASGYLQLAPRWVNALSQGSFECPSTEPAEQVGSPTPLAPLEWYESAPMQGAAAVAMLLAFLSYPISAIIGRIRRGRRSSPGRWAARVVSASGIVTVLATVCVLGYVMATGASDGLGPVALGRPVVWLVLQLLALLLLGAACWSSVIWWRMRRQVSRATHIRLAALLTGVLVFVPMAAWWGLLLV